MEQVVDESLLKKIVLYSDGGCEPPRGAAGFGIHGYFYSDEKPKQGSGAKGFFPTAEGYLPNAEKSDTSVEVTPLAYIDIVGGLPAPSTNNRAELSGFLHCLNILLKFKPEKATFFLDSKYVIDNINSIPKWKSIQWIKGDGEEVKNKDIWELIDEKLNELKAAEISYEIRWIKGHTGHVGNETADTQAGRGKVMGKNSNDYVVERLRPAKGYWKADNDYNRMLSHPRWFFFNNKDEPDLTDDGRYAYFLGDLGAQVEDYLFGKAMVTTALSIVYLEKPEMVLETMRQHQMTRKSPMLGNVVVGRLDNIFRPQVFNEVQDFGALFFKGATHKGDLFDSIDNPITIELHPPGLSHRGMEQFNGLLSIFNEHLENPEGTDELVVTDITHHFYEETTSKTKTVVKLKADIDGALKFVDIGVSYNLGEGKVDNHPVRLTLNVDLAKRNALSALAQEGVSLKVLTWKNSASSFRYATVLSVGKDVGIWAAPYSNIALVKST